MSRLSAPLSRSGSSRWVWCAAMVAAISGLTLLGSRPGNAEPTGPEAVDRPVTKAITMLMSGEHLTRHPLDDDISKRWMTNYLKMLDPRKVFFSQADVDGFMEYSTQLDDMALRGDTSFGYRMFQKYLERIDERVKLVDELL